MIHTPLRLNEMTEVGQRPMPGNDERHRIIRVVPSARYKVHERARFQVRDAMAGESTNVVAATWIAQGRRLRHEDGLQEKVTRT